jgi:hypothetical protein
MHDALRIQKLSEIYSIEKPPTTNFEVVSGIKFLFFTVYLTVSGSILHQFGGLHKLWDTLYSVFFTYCNILH